MTLPEPLAPGHVVMLAGGHDTRVVHHSGAWRVLSFRSHPENGCGVAFVATESSDPLAHLLETP